MENWEKEALFVLEMVKNEEEFMFSEDDAEHSKRKEHDAFVEKWGFSYNDVFDLDKSIAMFMLPRIAYFRAHNNGIPNCFIKVAEDGQTIVNEAEAIKEWNDILETICDGLHLYIEKGTSDFTEADKEMWKKAKSYIFEYFESLWN